jgi:hypothetical protein
MAACGLFPKRKLGVAEVYCRREAWLYQRDCAGSQGPLSYESGGDYLRTPCAYELTVFSHEQGLRKSVL